MSSFTSLDSDMSPLLYSLSLTVTSEQSSAAVTQLMDMMFLWEKTAERLRYRDTDGTGKHLGSLMNNKVNQVKPLSNSEVKMQQHYVTEQNNRQSKYRVYTKCLHDSVPAGLR